MEPTVPTLGPPPRRQAPRSPLRALAPIVVLSFLQSASFGIMGPMLPIAMTEYFARIYTQGTPVDCGRSPHLEACVYGSKEAAWLSSVFSAVGCGFLFFLSPVLGQASDVYGRKPFLVLSQVVRVGVPFSVMFFIQTNGSIWPYMILRLIDSGVGTAGVMSAAIADVVEPDQRAAAFGLSFASFSVGFCLASFIAPYSSRSRNLQIASGLFVFRVIWATVVLPETLPQRQYTNQKKTWHLENPIKSMAILYRSRLFICLTCLVALTSFVSNGLWQIRTFYLNTVLGFDEKNVAHLMLISGLASIFSQTVVLRPLMNCMRERGVIVVALVGCIVEAGGFAFTAFYPEKWIAFILTVPGCLSDLSFAAISSLKSINCSEKEQGRLQGAIYGARAIFEATGPVLFSTLYAAMKEEAKWSRAMPYLVASATYVVGIGVALSLPSASVTAPVPSEKRPLSPVPRPVPLVSPTFAMSPSAESGVSVLYESTDNDSGEEEDMFEPSVAYAVGWEEEVAELARPLMKSYEGDRIDA